MNRVVYLRPGTRRAERTRATPEPPPRESIEPELDRLSKRIGVLIHRTERAVTEHPWRALGAVAIAGVVLGMAFAPRSSKNVRQQLLLGALTFLGRRVALRALGDLGGEPRP